MDWTLRARRSNTVHIFAGSYFKDRRLLRFIGQPYLEYGRRVPGLQMIGFGSLRRFRLRISIAGDQQVRFQWREKKTPMTSRHG